MMKMNEQTKQKGFTLIELMIVVAIIGILAAIAIPQFSSYRLKAFNSAAVSDVRNSGLAEEGLYTDYQAYGASAAAGAAGGATTTALVSSAAAAVVATTTAGNEQNLSLSSGVTLGAVSDASGTTFVSAAKHLQGDRIVSIDADAAGLYWIASAAGTALVAGDVIAATAANDLTATMTAM